MIYDALIVLGGGIEKRGTLPAHVHARLQHAAAFMKKNNIPHIILSGRYGFTITPPPRVSEARIMKKALLTMGIPERKIFLEELSKDTIGNAFYVKKTILRRRGWKNVVLVTSHFHMPRARYVFKKILGTSYRLLPIAAPNMLSRTESHQRREAEKRLLVLTKLWLGRIAAGDDNALRHLMSTDHPAYARHVDPFTHFLVYFVTHGQH